MSKAHDAIIVGAGPVGLVTALLLARAGHRVVVLEAEPDIAEELRASTFHPPTLDMLDTLGLAAPLVAQGLVTPSWQIRQHETGERAVFDLSVLSQDTAFPFRLQAEQAKLSRLLLPQLAAAGATPRFNHRVTEVARQDSFATVAGEGFSWLRAT
jgi:3-(3-hydroxy-phenyl)propionate hydroxylase